MAMALVLYFPGRRESLLQEEHVRSSAGKSATELHVSGEYSSSLIMHGRLVMVVAVCNIC